MHIDLTLGDEHLQILGERRGGVYENSIGDKTSDISETKQSTLCSKKVDHQTHGGNFVKIILTDFQNSFTVRLSDKFATEVIDPTTP